MGITTDEIAQRLLNSYNGKIIPQGKYSYFKNITGKTQKYILR